MSFAPATALHKGTYSFSIQQVVRACLGAAFCALAACFFVACIGSAFPGQAFAETRMNPCAPTEDEVAAYQADGTLAQRQAFQESLGHESPDSDLLQAAIARQQQLEGASTFAANGHQPSYWAGGCPTVGTAKVIGLRVSFPDRKFAESDTLEAFKSLFTGEGSPSGFPYESLDAYYNRASYGALSFEAECFDYEAQHEQSYYAQNIDLLFREALDAFTSEAGYNGEKIRLRDFDGNNDNLVDAVYLHFACNEGEAQWGTTWWSQQWKMQGLSYEQDGQLMEICKVATLHEPSNNTRAARTLIHETGHVLGLPDYYHYDFSGSGAGANTDRTGILSFDMMFDNKGEHNGFSKWLLGWIDESRITRVTATADGVHMQDSTGETTNQPEAPVDLSLDAYSQPGQNGGHIAVVANHDTQGRNMFSSYYLVEYDGFEGNDSVKYQTNFEGTQGESLPSGFRIFRVQAQLRTEGDDFLKSNTFGSVHDQLIELVDPDENLPHATSDDFVSSVVDGGNGYGCMLFGSSDPITPTSTPVTTNFYENPVAGFTGLSFDALETSGPVGSLRVSYSGEGKPDPSTFSLECLTDEIFNVGTVEMQASSPTALATWEQGYKSEAYMLANGVRMPLKASVEGNRVRLSYCVNANELDAGATVDLVLPAGMFIVGTGDQGEAILSNEMAFTLEVGDLTKVESGQYANGEFKSRDRLLSNVVRMDEGKLSFLRLDAETPGVLYACSVDSSGIDVMSEVPCTLGDGEAFFEGRLNGAKLVATKAEDARLLVSFTPDAGQADTHGAFFLVDQTTGSAVRFDGRPLSRDSFSLDSSLVQMSSGWLDSGMAFCCEEEGAVRVAYSKDSIECMAPAGMQHTALLRHVQEGGSHAQVFDVVKTADLKDALSQGSPQIEDARNVLDGLDVVARLMPKQGSDPLELAGVTLTDQGYCAVAQMGNYGEGTFTAYWIVFDKNGEESSRFPIACTGTTQDTVEISMQEAPGGTVAFSWYPQQPEFYWTVQHTAFLDSEGKELSRMVTYAKADGAWLADGSWFGIGWDISNDAGAAGSPAFGDGSAFDDAGGEGGGLDKEEPWFDKDRHIRWVHTGVIDSGALDPVDPDPDPSGPGEGEDEGSSGEGFGTQGGGVDKPSGPQSGGAHGQGGAFAQTNDPMFYPGLVAFCLCCAGAVALVLTMRSKNRSDR